MSVGKRFKTEFKEEAGCLKTLVDGLLNIREVAACLTCLLAVIIVPVWLIRLPFRLLRVIVPSQNPKPEPAGKTGRQVAGEGE